MVMDRHLLTGKFSQNCPLSWLVTTNKWTTHITLNISEEKIRGEKIITGTTLAPRLLEGNKQRILRVIGDNLCVCSIWQIKLYGHLMFRNKQPTWICQDATSLCHKWWLLLNQSQWFYKSSIGWITVTGTWNHQGWFNFAFQVRLV